LRHQLNLYKKFSAGSNISLIVFKETING